MNISPFLTISHLSPHLAITTFVSFAVSVHTSIKKQLPPSPFPFFHSKLDYCTSLYHNLPKSQKTWLQQIRNSLARAVVKAPNSSHITPILRSLHWLKITLQSALNTSFSDLCTKFSQPPNLQPSYLHKQLITVQPHCSTRFSSLFTLARPSTSSAIRITDRSFQYASPRLSRLLSINHTLISPILTHPVLRVALLPYDTIRYEMLF